MHLSLDGVAVLIQSLLEGIGLQNKLHMIDIHYLEMLAAFLALKSFEGTIYGKHIKVMVDNTTAMTMINQIKFGSGAYLVMFGSWSGPHVWPSGSPND